MKSTITILQTSNGRIATKIIQKSADGEFEIVPFKAGTYYKAEQVEVDGISQLSRLLTDLEYEADKFIVRGGLHENTNLESPVRRRGFRVGDIDRNESPFEDNEQPWMMLDFDDVACPEGIDLARDPEAAVRHVIGLLPDEFKNVTCHWQFSSGAGIKEGIRVHLWYWLSEPMTSYDLKIKWGKKINSDKLIDTAMFQMVQPHYTAAPIFKDDASDPLTQRSGLLQGSTGSVKLNLDFPETEKTRSTGGGYISSGGGFYNILDRLGDDKDGFNDVLAPAAASFASEHGREYTESHREELKEELRDYIYEADQSGHTSSGIDRYMSDGYLDDIIKTGVEKFGDKEHLPPYFNKQERSFDDASRVLWEKVEKWTHEVYYYAGEQHQVQSEEKEVFEAVLPRPVVGIKAAAGIGKTTSILLDCLARGVFNGAVEYYVPSHTLSEQLREDVEDKLLEKYHDYMDEEGLSLEERSTVRVIRGRGTSNCKKYEETKLVVAAGLSVASTLCSSEEEQCEYYEDCPYQEQFNQFDPAQRDPEVAEDLHFSGRGIPTINIMAHQHLFLHSRDRLPDPEMIIVDESFFQAGIEEISTPIRELRKTKSKALRVIYNALLDQEPLLRTLRDQEITPTMLMKEAEQLADEEGQGMVTPSMSHSEQIRALSKYKKRSKLPRILGLLANELGWHGRSVSNCIEYREEDDEVVAHVRREINIPTNVPALFIDADLDKEIVQLFFEDKVRTTNIPVKRNAEVYQFTDKTFSKNDLIEPGSDEFRIGVEEFIKKVAKDSRTLVATTKKIRQKLTGEPNGSLPKFVDLHGAKIVHFTTLRGLNDFKDYDNVIVIGRNQPPHKAVENIARGLWFDDEKPIRFIQKTEGGYDGLRSGRRGYRLSEGSKHVVTQYHPDPRVQKVLEQIREAESTQAIDRLRMVRPRNDGKVQKVFVLSSVPLDLTVDHPVQWKEFQKIKDMWAESGGILPLHVDMMKVAPKSAGSKSTVKRMVGSYKDTQSLIKYFIPEDATEYKYKTESQRGAGHPIYIADRLNITKDKLSEILSEKVLLLE